MAELIDEIRFKATAPKAALPGLDDALRKLQAMDAALSGINRQLSGLSTHSAFTRTTKGIESAIKDMQTKGRGGNLRDVSKALGFNPKDVREYFLREQEKLNQAIESSERKRSKMRGSANAVARGQMVSEEKRLQGELNTLRRTFEGQQMRLSGAGSAARFFGGYQKAAVRNAKDPIAMMSALFSGGGGSPSPRPSPAGEGARAVLGAGRIPLIVPASQILATLGPGAITVRAGTSGTAGTGGTPGGGGGGGFGPGPVFGGGGAGTVLEEKKISTVKGRYLQRKERVGPGQTLDKFYTDVSGVMQQTKEVSTTRPEKAMEDRQREIRGEMRRQGQLRRALESARQRGDRDAERRIEEERRTLERQIAARNKVLSARQKSDDAAQKQAAKVAEFNRQQQQGRAFRSATYSGADAAWQDFLNRGGRMTSERSGKGGRTLSGELELPGNKKETITVTYGAAGAQVTRLTKAMSEARKEGGYLAGDFVKNTAKVAMWAASVTALYKTVELATHSLSELVEISPQIGRLEQVFKGVGGSAQELTADILEVAAANGADTHEAMEAAIQWSRLGLTRSQVNEAVRLSTIAANVAQIDSLEATQKLQGIMQGYGLTLNQLRGELGQIVSISNQYNVTTSDLLTGLSRVASVAKQAGLPLAELQGFLGATIGKTAQSGANIGNMLKSVLLALSNPALQKELRTGFQLEVTTGGQDIRGMSEVLRELFLRYNELTDAQRQSLLFSIAGKTQASRLAALLDNYVKAQTLAVNAQLQLNTAEAENAKIKAALRTQLAGLTAEWERFVVIQGNRGPVQVLGELSKALRNVLTLMNTGGGSWATTGMMGLMTAASMKVFLTGMTMKDAAGQPGFIARSGARVLGAASGLNSLVNSAVMQFAGGNVVGATGPMQPAGIQRGVLALNKYGDALFKVAQSSNVSSLAVRAFAGAMGVAAKSVALATVALAEFLVPLLIIAAGIYVFNQAMEAIGLSSEAATKKLAGFNAEAEKAGSAAGAALEAANLFKTVERALPTMRSDTDRARMLSQAAEATHGDIADPTERARAVEATKEQWLMMLKMGQAAELNKALEGERAKELQRNFDLLQSEYEARQRGIRATADEVSRLESRQRGFFGPVGAQSRQKSIDELKARQSEMESAQVRNTLDRSNIETLEERLKYDERIAAALEVQRISLEAIGELYQGINANNPFEKAQLRAAGLEAQSRAIDLRMATLHTEDQSDFTGKDEREKELKRLQEEEKTVRDRIAAIADEWHPSPDVEQEQRMFAARGQLSKNLEEQNSVRGGLAPGIEPDDSMRRTAERKELIEQQRKVDAERAAIEANMKLFEAQTQMQFGREEGRRQTTPFEVGRDETQKLLNRRTAAADALGELDSHANKTIEERGRMLELERQIYEANMALRERAFTVEKDINQLIVDRRKEFEHSLLGAGPAELLRKLAAFKMGGNGKMGIGQFLSLSPEMRRDVSMVDPRFDPSMMDLQRERSRFRPGSAESFNRDQMEISRAIAQLGATLKASLPDVSAYQAAAQNVSRLATSAAAAADALDRIAGARAPAVQSPRSNVQSPASTAGAAPRLPQAGGTGAGAGHNDRMSTAELGAVAHQINGGGYVQGRGWHAEGNMIGGWGWDDDANNVYIGKPPGDYSPGMTDVTKQ